MKYLVTMILGIYITVLTTGVMAQDCKPAPKDVATLKEIRPKFFTVEGPLAEFNPCHSSV